MYDLWLFLHVLGAIVAFGFGFYAPVFGAAAAGNPSTATGTCAPRSASPA